MCHCRPGHGPRPATLHSMSLPRAHRADRAPPLAALCPPASRAREISPRSKLPSSSPRPMAIVMSACIPTTTREEASSRASTPTRRATAFSRRLRSTRATEYSATKHTSAVGERMGEPF
ncbi:hypothetical protein HYPSUDRAFT_333837 [Hypholoma sublateritium FD-334 SS-4]|uniref:Uncharacterized protein n=1 Tax=Hypholoma sublateritium (strain FD-334 SS-4) TaxID=945553 RepID=A0A0D2KMS9_HYPSF|nr:hypothetical protein HYPSUDRAFT_333837 [Hypholoma sublateritium FD-334 SS-4]